MENTVELKVSKNERITRSISSKKNNTNNKFFNVDTIHDYDALKIFGITTNNGFDLNKSFKILYGEPEVTKNGDIITNQGDSVTNMDANVTNKEINMTNNDHSMTKKEDIITDRKEKVTKKRESLTNAEDMITNIKQFITNKSTELTNRLRSITHKTHILTNKNKILTNKVASMTNDGNDMTNHVSKSNNNKTTNVTNGKTDSSTNKIPKCIAAEDDFIREIEKGYNSYVFENETNDPLNDAFYFQRHRPLDREEKHFANTEKEKIAFEFFRITEKLDNLKSPEWRKEVCNLWPEISDNKSLLLKARSDLIKDYENVISKYNSFKVKEKEYKIYKTATMQENKLLFSKDAYDRLKVKSNKRKFDENENANKGSECKKRRMEENLESIENEDKKNGFGKKSSEKADASENYKEKTKKLKNNNNANIDHFSDTSEEMEGNRIEDNQTIENSQYLESSLVDENNESDEYNETNETMEDMESSIFENNLTIGKNENEEKKDDKVTNINQKPHLKNLAIDNYQTYEIKKKQKKYMGINFKQRLKLKEERKEHIQKLELRNKIAANEKKYEDSEDESRPDKVLERINSSTGKQPFVSFFKKRFLFVPFDEKIRRSNRKGVYAFGHPIKLSDQRDFSIPSEWIDEYR